MRTHKYTNMIHTHTYMAHKKCLSHTRDTIIPRDMVISKSKSNFTDIKHTFIPRIKPNKYFFRDPNSKPINRYTQKIKSRLRTNLGMVSRHGSQIPMLIPRLKTNKLFIPRK